ncbi:MAG TPA: hypothetical protein VF503_08935 [Sphingobium sp.]
MNDFAEAVRHEWHIASERDRQWVRCAAVLGAVELIVAAIACLMAIFL